MEINMFNFFSKPDETDYAEMPPHIDPVEETKTEEPAVKNIKKSTITIYLVDKSTLIFTNTYEHDNNTYENVISSWDNFYKWFIDPKGKLNDFYEFLHRDGISTFRRRHVDRVTINIK